MKEHEIKSVAFVSSDKFFSGDPDFDWMHSVVDRALDPPPPATVSTPDLEQDDEEQDEEAPPDDASDVTDPEDPGATVTVSDTCGYAPTS